MINSFKKLVIPKNLHKILRHKSRLHCRLYEPHRHAVHNGLHLHDLIQRIARLEHAAQSLADLRRLAQHVDRRRKNTQLPRRERVEHVLHAAFAEDRAQAVFLLAVNGNLGSAGLARVQLVDDAGHFDEG